MPINEQSTQDYLLARDVFVDSYKDFLRKLLGLLEEAEQTTSDPDIRQDVAHLAGDVKVLKEHIDDFQDEETRAKQQPLAQAPMPSEEAASKSEEDFEPSSLGEAESQRQKSKSDSDSPKVPHDSADKSAAEAQTSSPSDLPKIKTESQDSADELQAEVESGPSQLTASDEAIDGVPLVFAPPATDDSRVVSAFCAFRYHKAEFRQLFQRQGSNNSCSTAAAAAAAAVMTNNAAAAAATATASKCCCIQPVDELLNNPPSWLGPLAQYTLHLMRRAFRTASPAQWEALKPQLAGLGFKAEEHFALWLRLSSAAQDDVTQDPDRVFDAIPALSGLSERLALETKILLQTLNLLSG